MNRAVAVAFVLATVTACSGDPPVTSSKTSAVTSPVPATSSVTVSSSPTTDGPTTTAPPATDTVVTSTTDDAPTVTTGGQAAQLVEFDGEVFDPVRSRRIPYRVYAPIGVEGPVPVILVSHGSRGSDTGYTRGSHLGSTFAAGGYLAIHVGHVASTTQRPVDDRPTDVGVVLDLLESDELALPAEFTGVVDLSRVGHTGHSYGAYTSLALGGADYGVDRSDDRIDAIAPISPAGPGQFGAYDRGPGDNTWLSVTIPAYNLVGGDEIDTNAPGTIDEPGWRLTPFERYPDQGDKYQTIIAEQSHDSMWQTGSDAVERFVAGEILRFFDVYVAGDPGADRCLIGAGDIDVETITARIADPDDGRLAGCPPP